MTNSKNLNINILKNSLFQKLFKLISSKQKLALWGLFLVFLISAIFNIFSYVLLGPLIGLASGADQGILKTFSNFLSRFLGSSDVTIKYAFFVLLFQIIRIFLRVISSYLSIVFLKRIVRKLFQKVLSRNMNLSYVDYQKKDFHLVARDLSLVDNYSILISTLIEISSSFIIFLGYTVLLFYLDWKMTSIIYLYFFCIFLAFQLFLKNYIKIYGMELYKYEMQRNRSINILFRNFKFIKTRGESIYDLSSQYVGSAVKSFVKREFLNILDLLNNSLIELSGILVLVAMIVFFSLKEEGISQNLSLLSIYAISFYRMIPIIQEILGRYQSLFQHHNAVEVLNEVLNQSIEYISYEGDSIAFQKEIVLKNVYFSYEPNKSVLEDISFTIQKGDRVGIVGESGAGKTTLADILIGLLQPDKGEIFVDGVLINSENLGRWRKSIGYIPQSIFLFDGTVAENVAFDKSLEDSKVIESLEKAHIWEFLKTKEGIHTHINLDGTSLSGGQRQRIGIARTLYSGFQFIVLDESTSALDNKTEEEIMKEVYSFEKESTLFIIAHRLTTLDQCNKIIHLDKGQIKSIEIRDTKI